MNQLDIVLNHLRKAKSISRREALVDYSIQNITATISALRKLGYPIVSSNKTHPTTGQRYMRYTMARTK
jgi:hypothetical protein